MCRFMVVLAVVAWCLLDCVGASAEVNRPEHFGVCLPMPQTLPDTIAASKAAHVMSLQIVPLVLTVTTEGRVSAVTTPVDSLARFADYMRTFFRQAVFLPGTIEGAPAEMSLPVRAVFRYRVRLPQLHFPVDTLGLVHDRELYFEGIAANGVTLPEVLRFPSIHFDRRRFDTSDVTYPFALLRVALDEAGRPVSREIVRSTVGTFGEQVRSALLYAEFQPAVIRGRADTASVFVLVSFLPHQNFPSRVWMRDRADTVSLYERLLIRSFADTLGLLSVPLTRHFPSDEYSFRGPHTLQRGLVGVSIGVDTVGKVRIGVPGQWPREIISGINEFGRKFRMYAAMDYSGRPVTYEGEGELGFVGSGLIRTRFFWLP
jgi:hypothetical protein